MANEIIIRKSETLGKSKLGTITKKIIDLGNKEIENEKTRAQLITQVVDEEMFKPAFETASEWAEKFLSINKSTLSRLLSVTRRFANVETVYLANDYGDTFRPWDDLTLSQMFEIYKATDDEIEAANINPKMTCKEIREAIKAKNEVIDIPDGAETEATAEPAESSDTETEAEETEAETNGHTVTYMCDKSFNDINKVFEYIAENAETADILIKKRGEWYSIYKSKEQI